ncbi:hypothetical protein A0H81_10193 [Grifola frondosa]|uniref:MYND-type domain-containing protein n=1 Tax=Grifola frondosa TaxID=5627 RepID=A0A1C7LYC0_GRIFR|nr:hypothetical protein A0H81_10193 [Grifola frondosa]
MSRICHRQIQSKACQKAAWPSHKEKCKVNQRAHGGLGDVPAPLKDLRAFTSKHRPSLAEAGIRALDACADPSRTKKFLLVVFLRSRPDSRRIETMFYATGADVVPFDMFPQAEEMRGMLRLAHEENVRTGFMGTLNVILLCVDTGTSNVMPVGFDPHTPLEPLSMDWKSCLMKKLNEGIVS